VTPTALLAAAKDGSSAVRMGVLLALRRLHRDEIATFLSDKRLGDCVRGRPRHQRRADQCALRELAALIGRDGVPPNPEFQGSQRARAPGELFRSAVAPCALNANFHFGTKENASALAAFARAFRRRRKMRVEALDELADWAILRGVTASSVSGVLSPPFAGAKRQSRPCNPRCADILRNAPDNVRVAAVHAVSRLTITGAAPVLSELLADNKISSRSASRR